MISPAQVLLFLLFSLVFLILTLKRPHAHRFFRFAAFECILALILLNADVWFRDPLSLLQLASWVTLSGSLVLAIHGFSILRSRGEPRGDIDETTKLVVAGVYRYIRHPLYLSLFLLGLGAFLKDPNWLGLFLLGLEGSMLYATALAEERGNLEKFGEAYRDYMSQSKRFIPYVF